MRRASRLLGANADAGGGRLPCAKITYHAEGLASRACVIFSRNRFLGFVRRGGAAEAAALGRRRLAHRRRRLEQLADEFRLAEGNGRVDDGPAGTRFSRPLTSRACSC